MVYEVDENATKCSSTGTSYDEEEVTKIKNKRPLKITKCMPRISIYGTAGSYDNGVVLHKK